MHNNYTRRYTISVRRLMSLHMFVFNVVFFNQRFVGLSWTPKQCYFVRDQVCRWEQCVCGYALEHT